MEFVSTITTDLRLALRGLRLRPAFSLITISTLGLALGAVVTIFSAIQAVLLAPLPYESPSELVGVWQDHTNLDGPQDEWVSADNFFVWRDTSESFSGMFLFGGNAPTLQGETAEMLNGGAVSQGAFEVLGVVPILGRGFLPEDDVAGAPSVATLGHDLWLRRFGGSERVIGQILVLDGEPTTVVGVMPAGFEVPGVAGRDIFQPTRVDSSNSCGHGCVTFRAIARLAPNVSLTQAREDMGRIAAGLAEEFPANRDVGIFLEPLTERVTGPYRSGLWMLFGAVIAVLLIACSNIANLMLARAAGRQQEMTVRAALGAGRRRLARTLLTESLVLAVAGGLVGVLLAGGGVRLLKALAPGASSRFEAISLDGLTLGFAAAVALGAALLFGLVPTLRSVRNAGEELRVRGDGGSGRLRGGLVIVQVAAATVLLVGGLLLARSFGELMSVDPGFEPEGLLTQQMFLPRASYEDGEQLRAFSRRMLSAVDSLPGVAAAGTVNSLPLRGNDSDTGFLIDGRPLPGAGERAPVAWTRVVTPGYLEAAKLRLVEGRMLAEADRADAQPVVMINEAAARRYWPGGDALGSRVRFGRTAPYREVVAVVGDTKQFGLAESDRPAIFLPFDQQPGRFMTLVLRTAQDPASVAAASQAEIAKLDPSLAVSSVATMREVIDGSVEVERMLRTVLLGFAAVAMLLAALGLYGVMTYTVSLRIPEMGLRSALGATPGSLLRTVLSSGAVLVAAGLALGVLLSAGASRLLERMLFGVTPYDPLTFAATAIVLVAVGLLACLVPAWRAMRVDPLEALRYE